MKKITAWIMVLCIVIVTVLLPPGKTEAYTITEKGGMRTASELSEVVFIRDIDKLSEICQNALLIFMEKHNAGPAGKREADAWIL